MLKTARFVPRNEFVQLQWAITQNLSSSEGLFDYIISITWVSINQRMLIAVQTSQLFLIQRELPVYRFPIENLSIYLSS